MFKKFVFSLLTCLALDFSTHNKYDKDKLVEANEMPQVVTLSSKKHSPPLYFKGLDTYGRYTEVNNPESYVFTFKELPYKIHVSKEVFNGTLIGTKFVVVGDDLYMCTIYIEGC